MVKLKNILIEELNLFECQVLLKTKSDFNKIDIFNQIRSISGVVIVNVIHSEFLDSKSIKNFEYSLITIKYSVNGSPKEDIKKIGRMCLNGDGIQPKIEGIIFFLPRLVTIKKVRR